MIWEFMRDIGLIVFAVGIFAFGLSKIPRRYLDFPNTALVATIGDAMMLAGASLAVTAMAFGYLVPAEKRSLPQVGSST
jgi:hypothetical protein